MKQKNMLKKWNKHHVTDSKNFGSVYYLLSEPGNVAVLFFMSVKWDHKQKNKITFQLLIVYFIESFIFQNNVTSFIFLTSFWFSMGFSYVCCCNFRATLL